MEPKIFALEKILDDPRYGGFFTGNARLLNTVPKNRKGVRWEVERVAEAWTPPKVSGLVRKYNDYPCVDLGTPAYSRRAVDVLRDFLEPNGELLPLLTPWGEFFAYNVTTITDALDAEASEMNAFQIVRYSFDPSKIEGLTIFLLSQQPRPYVTEKFVNRALQANLRGFDFQPVWPLPPGVTWNDVRKEARHLRETEGLPAGKTLKGNSVVISFLPSMKIAEQPDLIRKNLEKAVNELTLLLFDAESEAPAVGHVERINFNSNQIALSCPDADLLVAAIRSWLVDFKWDGDTSVVKRYGNFADAHAKCEVVRVS